MLWEAGKEEVGRPRVETRVLSQAVYSVTRLRLVTRLLSLILRSISLVPQQTESLWRVKAQRHPQVPVPGRRAPVPSVPPPRLSCLGNGAHHRGIYRARRSKIFRCVLLNALGSCRSHALEMVINPWPSTYLRFLGRKCLRERCAMKGGGP